VALNKRDLELTASYTQKDTTMTKRTMLALATAIALTACARAPTDDADALERAADNAHAAADQLDADQANAAADYTTNQTASTNTTAAPR